jgi:lipopolysaccharide heptosyltransferase II
MSERLIPDPIRQYVEHIYLYTRGAFLLPFLSLRKALLFHKEDIRNILFLRHDRVGDMVLSTPALKALRRTYPKANITVLASKRNYEIIQNNPNIDKIVVFRGWYWFLKKIRKKGVDLTIDPFNTYELKQALLSYLSGARHRIGFEEAGRQIFFNIKGPKLQPAKHLVEHILELVGYLGCDVNGCEPELFLTDEEVQWASSLLLNKAIDTSKMTVALHPGGHFESQRWPLERFGRVAEKITEELKGNVVIFAGPDERVILDRIKQMCGGDVFIISDISIRQVMAILSRCDLFLGNNSGPLHIAAALGLPTVSTIGPTVTPLWLPYGKKHIVLKKELDCSPCTKGVCENHSCMKLITINDVLDAVKSQMGDNRLN